MTGGYPSKSAHIRALASRGMPAADIARAVGVRYQHARKVLLDADLLPARASRPTKVGRISAAKEKPALSAELLLESGFSRAGEWYEDGGVLMFRGDLPKGPGVYAFAGETNICYVGVATMGLAKRLYFYRKPGISQTTSLRVRAALLEHLKASRMDVLVAEAGATHWNGLPVDLNAGLELGIIKNFSLPWNKRGVK